MHVFKHRHPSCSVDHYTGQLGHGPLKQHCASDHPLCNFYEVVGRVECGGYG